MRNSENAIEVRDIKKKFKVYYDKGHTLKEKALHSSRNKYEEREVLKGISFDVKKGEAVGLIGHNGCGKSTTLKLLTRIMYPDEGTIELCGRVSSLLELGAGFHPDMSGRENIYTNASIFGLSKKEIDKRIAEIIEFSELEEFIDNPVRTYSSGMYMRLAFSVAINVNADILLIDEILAVGDVNFQKKCFNKLMEIKGAGTTIVLVSHSTTQIERICDRSIWIQDGQIQSEGRPIDVHREYLNYMSDQRNAYEIEKDEVEQEPKQERAQEQGQQEWETEEKKEDVCVESVKLLDKEKKKKKIFRVGDKVEIKVELNAKKLIENYYIEVNLVRADGVFCYGCSSSSDKVLSEPWQGRKYINLSFEHMNLLAGKYHFDIHIANEEGRTIYFAGNIAEFEVDASEFERGLIYLEHEWTKG